MSLAGMFKFGTDMFCKKHSCGQANIALLVRSNNVWRGGSAAAGDPEHS